MIQNARSIVLKSVVVVATIAVAWGLATGYVNMRQDAQFYEDRAVTSSNILEDMGTINVGDTLRDALFETLTGEQVLLSGLLSTRTMLMVVSPGCDACRVEFELLNRNVTDSANGVYFVLLSSAKPDVLKEIRDEYGITSRVLYDFDKQYINHLGITSFPFNIVVDDNLVIQEIVADVLVEDDFEKMIKYNRNL